MKLKAYAKINLTLDITGRREDGFHTLDTVMQSVSVFDMVELRRTEKPGVRVWCSKEYLPVDTKNTAYRAASLFLEYCGLTGGGVEISLEKSIPTRAGMGGGSADAAAVLRGLDRLFETKLPLSTLMELGSRVGADVPFCVRGGACRCTGIGETVEPVPVLPPCILVVCKPPAGMSTPRAYALIDRFPPARAQATPKMLRALGARDLRQIGQSLSNRFDQTMRLMQVKEIKRTMASAGALGAMMTGSGSAVYGIFDTPQKAENCRILLEGKGEIFMARPLTEAEAWAE